MGWTSRFLSPLELAEEVSLEAGSFGGGFLRCGDAEPYGMIVAVANVLSKLAGCIGRQFWQNIRLLLESQECSVGG